MIPWWWLIVAWVGAQAAVLVWLWFFRKPEDEAIQMLQAGNASLMNMIDEECEKTARLERERDALTNDLYLIVNNHVTPCFCCKIFDPSTTVCEYEGDVDCFIWRGVPEKEEEHEADSD